MKKLFTLIAAASLAIPSALFAADEVVAFPGAEGFGRLVTGGRGGEVYHVTNLEDSGEGSLRWALSQAGTKTIVFDVSGTIQLKSALSIGSNVTLAGQTAPGDGICVAGFPVTVKGPNAIVRFMRFRLGNENVSKHEGDGLGGMDSRNIIVDHCSVSWSVDECLSVYGSRNITVQWCFVTQSMVNSGHSKGAHGYGGNWGGSGASYHHNLIAHHSSRTPRLGPRPGTQKDERMDMRNNVIYNWGGNGCYGGEAMTVNIVNNYYKPGPATPSGTKGKRIAAPGIRTVDYCLDKEGLAVSINYNISGFGATKSNISGVADMSGTCYVSVKGTRYPINWETNSIEIQGKTITLKWNSWKPTLHQWGRYYVVGNVNSKYSDVTEDNFNIGVGDQIGVGSGVDYTIVNPKDDKTFMQLHTPMEFESVTTHSAEEAYERVLQFGGASLHRDAYDAMMVEDARTGTASSVVSGLGKGFINNQNDVVYSDGSKGWPVLNSAEAKVDTDGDGMPDEWETANGLNPDNAEDGKIVGDDGYTNLEHYLNSLVADIVEGGNAGGQLLSGTSPYVGAGISDIVVDGEAGEGDGRIFNLMGIECHAPLAPGIYICNGKKFVVR